MSYTSAALRGGSYNTAALMGGSYNTAALRGGNARLLKGSAAAKARMAYLRSLRGKKKASGGKRLSSKRDVILTFLSKPVYNVPVNRQRGGSLIDTFSKVATAAKENPELVDVVKKGANFWGNWIGENIKHNRGTDAEIARLEAEIAAYERMSPEQKKAFKRQHRAAQQGLKTAMPHILAKMKRNLGLARDATDKINQAKAPPLPPRDPPPLPPRDIPPPLPPRDIPPPLPPRNGVAGGMDMRDLRDGFLGPYGWIAMGVRKGKEKKLDALRDKWWDIRYN